MAEGETTVVTVGTGTETAGVAVGEGEEKIPIPEAEADRIAEMPGMAHGVAVLEMFTETAAVIEPTIEEMRGTNMIRRRIKITHHPLAIIIDP